jgi:N-acetylmuramoyl-L-alanine amidase
MKEPHGGWHFFAFCLSPFAFCLPAASGCAIVAVALAAGPAAAQQWKPQKNVEIVVAAGAGGSADRGSRVAQTFLAALPDIPSVLVELGVLTR